MSTGVDFTVCETAVVPQAKTRTVAIAPLAGHSSPLPMSTLIELAPTLPSFTNRSGRSLSHTALQVDGQRASPPLRLVPEVKFFVSRMSPVELPGPSDILYQRIRCPLGQ